MKPLHLLALLTAASTGCSEEALVAKTEPRLAITVAPLDLPSLDDACYDVTVYNAALPANGDVVWSKSDICAQRYGDGEGSVTYVGTCDASGLNGQRDNSVRLVLTDLCSGGACEQPGPGATSLDAASYANPCPAPGGCVLTRTCRENADTQVVFNLTVLRGANQGFFDVAVNFEDIFCSAKFDCESPSGGPIELLHDPATGRRSTTAVLGFACTSGAGSETWLYMNDVTITCHDAGGAVVSTTAIDPSGAPGNLGPRGSLVYQSAVYRGSEALVPYEKCYWNMAFGIRENQLAASGGKCVLSVRATAADKALTNNQTPADTRYPVIAYEVELNPEGGLSCGKHGVNEPGSEVQTEYTALTGETFTHFVACDDPLTAGGTPGRTLCDGQVSGVDELVSFTVTEGSLVARAGSLESPAYPLPPEHGLGGCCLDPCCSP
jgi:hypothetical protein